MTYRQDKNTDTEQQPFVSVVMSTVYHFQLNHYCMCCDQCFCY